MMIGMMTFHFEYMLWTTIASAANEKIGNFLFGMNCVWTFKEFPLSCFWFPHEYFGNLRINSARNSHSMHEIDFSFIWFRLFLSNNLDFLQRLFVSVPAQLSLPSCSPMGKSLLRKSWKVTQAGEKRRSGIFYFFY